MIRRHRALRRLAIAPIAITTAVFIFGFIIGFRFLLERMPDIAKLSLGLAFALKDESLTSRLLVWNFEALCWPMAVALLLVTLFLIARVVAAPFYGLLAERSLIVRGLKSPEPFRLVSSLRTSLHLALVALANAAVFSFIAVVLVAFSILPGFGLFAAFGFLTLAAFNILDLSYDALRIGFRQRFLYVRRDMAGIFGLAVALGLVFLVPGLNFILFPASVVGATGLFRRAMNEFLVEENVMTPAATQPEALKNLIHEKIIVNMDKVEAWFRDVRAKVDVPFYSSYDIRDSGLKITNIDANIYPAGFNNICPVDRENCGELIREYIERHYRNAGQTPRRVLILTEEHTNNPYYWDNVSVLKELMEDAGLETRLAVPRRETSLTVMQSASRGPVEVYGATIASGRISVEGFAPDLVVSNNDFSEYYEEWGSEIETPLNPPRELGWYRRKKSTYFKHFNQLSSEFAGVIGIDPFVLTVETELMEHFDIGSEDSRRELAKRVDDMIARLKVEYEKRGIEESPFVFVKNNSGTYGLGVIRVGSGADVLALNNKTRKKMKAAKGGRDVEEIIIQEGVRSIVRADGVTAEPTIYLLGCQLAGGFLRSHAEKDETESLNSPGAVYKRLCVSDLKINVHGNPLENVYGWVAKLGLLAIGRESAEMGVVYKKVPGSETATPGAHEVPLVGTAGWAAASVRVGRSSSFETNGR